MIASYLPTTICSGTDLDYRTGYQFNFLDRRELVQALYDNLQDKSKVHVSKGLLNIDHLDTGVTVTAEDGTTFAGDILVGADGVHSQTRKEMWRIADSEVPDYGTQQMAKCGLHNQHLSHDAY